MAKIILTQGLLTLSLDLPYTLVRLLFTTSLHSLYYTRQPTYTLMEDMLLLCARQCTQCTGLLFREEKAEPQCAYTMYLESHSE